MLKRYAPISLLFFPALLLALISRISKVAFHSDDLGYWTLAWQWREAIKESGFLPTLKTIYQWSPTRPTFHSLIGTIALAFTDGSIDQATLLVGLLFSALICFSLYGIFMRLGFSRGGATLASAALATFPHFLSQGRFFMAEYPFAGFLLAALAALLSGQYVTFALFYFLALTERILEGTLIFPALAAFFLFRWRFSLRHGVKFLIATGAALIATTTCLWPRFGYLAPWIASASFSRSGGNPWRFIQWNEDLLRFLPQVLFGIFGFTGSLVIMTSLFQAIRRRAYPELLLLLSAFTCFSAILLLIGSFDNPITVAANWRYSLGFMLLFSIAALACFRPSLGPVKAEWVLGPLLFANLAVLFHAFFAAELRPASFATSSINYHRLAIHSSSYPYGLKETACRMKQLIGGENSSAILEGSDRGLSEIFYQLRLRYFECGGKSLILGVPGGDYRRQILELELRSGSANLSRYGIGAVVFLHPSLGRADLSIPRAQESFFRALNEGNTQKLGLKRIARLEASWSGDPLAFEIFQVENSQFSGQGK